MNKIIYKIPENLSKKLNDKKLVHIIEEAIVRRLADFLTYEDMIKIELMLEDDDPTLESFIKSKCPSINNIVEEEINKRIKNK